MAIFHVESRAWIAIAIYQVLIVSYIDIETEAFSLHLNGLDPDHR